MIKFLTACWLGETKGEGRSQLKGSGLLHRIKLILTSLEKLKMIGLPRFVRNTARHLPIRRAFLCNLFCM